MTSYQYQILYKGTGQARSAAEPQEPDRILVDWTSVLADDHNDQGQKTVEYIALKALWRNDEYEHLDPARVVVLVRPFRA